MISQNNDIEIPEISKDYIYSLDEVEASDLYRQMRNYSAKIEELRKNRTEPLLSEIKEIRAQYNGIETYLDVLTGYLKQHLADFENNRPSDAVKPEGMVTTYRTAPPKLVISDENLIPRELMIPDEKRIIQLLKEGTAVPGCSLLITKTPSL